jgi:hypothetical protein
MGRSSVGRPLLVTGQHTANSCGRGQFTPGRKTRQQHPSNILVEPMNWRAKANALRLLGSVPGGRRVYHKAQRILGTNQIQPAEQTNRAIEVVELILHAGADPKGMVCLEIGTGWHPFLPSIMYLCGARRIISLDVNAWLTRAYTLETFRSLADQLDVISRRLRIDPETLRHRYSRMAGRESELGALLESIGLEYHCPADARKTGLPDESVDFVCSSNVLEHISPDALSAIHNECRRILRRGGLSVHRINPGDHFARSDSSITTANFLRFSPRQWHRLAGDGIAYHNRLRCCQHVELLSQAGFTIHRHKNRIDTRALEAIRSGLLTVHPDFASFSSEELAADYLHVVAQCPPA